MVKGLNNIGSMYSLSFLDAKKIKEILETLYKKYKD